MAIYEDDVSMGWEDILVIALYFVIVLGIGFYASFRAKTDSSEGYFLAGRSTTWIPVGASTFSTNMGAPMFVGLGGSAAATGIAVVMFEWHAMWMLLLLGWLFLPVYLSSGCFTMPQYLKMRYGGQRIRVWLAVINIFLTIISSISGQMYAGALFIQQIFHWDLYVSISLILFITALYTLMGGLTAVIWTDTIQTAILLVGATVVSALAISQVNSFETIREIFIPSASNETLLAESLYGNVTCGFAPDNAFHIFRPASDGNYPWPGMIFGLTILATNAWCTDQACVQRSLSAKSLTHAKGGLILAAYLKFLPFFFFIIPGMISRILYPNEIACTDPDLCNRICENPAGCSNVAYPLLVLRILPVGVRGLMMAALMSALMSSLTSYFNSSSTVFVMDLYRRCRRKAKESELMVVGRLWTVVLAVVALLWLPALQKLQGSNFWDYTQSISSFINPPIVMVFLFGLFWTRTTEKAAFSGLVVGLCVGVIRMGLEWSRTAPPCGSDEPNNTFDIVTRVHYLHFAVILAAITSIVIVFVSIVTQPRSPEQLRRVTWWTRQDQDFPEVSDDEEDEVEEEEDGDVRDYEEQRDKGCVFKTKNCVLKYLCGVDNLKPKPEKMTPEEHLAAQRAMTNIGEDPFWARFLDWNAVACAAVCFFLHAFWY